jgi:hypothetical protein
MAAGSVSKTPSELIDAKIEELGGGIGDKRELFASTGRSLTV